MTPLFLKEILWMCFVHIFPKFLLTFVTARLKGCGKEGRLDELAAMKKMIYFQRNITQAKKGEDQYVSSIKHVCVCGSVRWWQNTKEPCCHRACRGGEASARESGCRMREVFKGRAHRAQVQLVQLMTLHLGTCQTKKRDQAKEAGTPSVQVEGSSHIFVIFVNFGMLSQILNQFLWFLFVFGCTTWVCIDGATGGAGRV